jgi:DNA repair protein RadA/Sms
MARRNPRFACQECGAVSARWAGRCESCGAWNALLEEPAAFDIVTEASGRRPSAPGMAVELQRLDSALAETPRLRTGIDEFDRVAGGGLVPGSAILVGGDPGIGKSTLLLQVAARRARAGASVVYVSGEEANAQVQLRARRLGAADAPVALASETSVENVLATLERGRPPALVIIDSVQTMWTSTAEASPGTVTQVRAAAQALVRYAKRSGAVVVLVGHVTKDGQIAGPKVVEHLVDAVFTFEGDAGHVFRLLRGAKNRFGATDELGVFEMTGAGLQEVANPSELFLGDRAATSPGAAVFAGIEGTRPILVEIQALVAPSSLGTPRRAVIGWDSSRLAMVLAVLEARCGFSLGASDVYLAVASGLKVSEPAADLAVAAALISSRVGLALPRDTVYFGEISLSGRLRQVVQTPGRWKEAEKLGFTGAVLPDASTTGLTPTISLQRISILSELIELVAPSGEPTMSDPTVSRPGAGGARIDRR